jgi:hypothetical protein
VWWNLATEAMRAINQDRQKIFLDGAADLIDAASSLGVKFGFGRRQATTHDRWAQRSACRPADGARSPKPRPSAFSLSGWLNLIYLI